MTFAALLGAVLVPLAAAQQARGPVEPPERFPIIGSRVFGTRRGKRQRQKQCKQGKTRA